MPRAMRGRAIAAIAVSAALHALVLSVLALHTPKPLIPPREPAGPPEPIIPVLLTPRLPPPAPGAREQPAVVRLHRRRLRFAPANLPVAPLPVPPQPTEPPRTPSPAPAKPLLPEGPRELARQALRQGPVGCANPQAAGLNRAEREACEEQWGRGAVAAPFIPPGMAAASGRRGELDRAAAARDAARRDLEAPLPPSANDPMGTSGQPWQVRRGER